MHVEYMGVTGIANVELPGVVRGCRFPRVAVGSMVGSLYGMYCMHVTSVAGTRWPESITYECTDTF